MYKSIKVFLSSTFLDMQEERDYLNRVIFPKFEIECKKRGVDFYPIDLRWGITDDQTKNNETIYFCLKQVDYAMPFFIGFIGNRYGWVPENIDYLFNAYPHMKDNLGKSATELEMLHYFHLNQNKEDCLFLLKDESICNKEYEDIENSLKLNQLKDKLNKSNYSLNYDSIIKMGEYVYEKLMNWLDKKYPILSLEEQQEKYKEKLTHFYLSISKTKQILEQIDDDVKTNIFKYAGIGYFGLEVLEKIDAYYQGKVLCLKETKGNAMFINALLYHHYTYDKTIYIFLESSKELQNPYNLKKHLISRLVAHIPMMSKYKSYSHLPYTYENNIKVQSALFDILTSSKLNERINIYITNLNLIDKDNLDYFLNFIPVDIVSNFSFILTTSDENQLKYLLKERGYVVKNFPITLDFKSEYIGYVLSYLDHFGKKIDMEQAHKLYNYNLLTSYNNCDLLCKYLINYTIHNDLKDTIDYIINNANDGLIKTILNLVFKDVNTNEKEVIKYIFYLANEIAISDSNLYSLINKKYSINKIEYAKLFEKASMFLKITENGYKLMDEEVYNCLNIKDDYFDDMICKYYIDNIKYCNDKVAHMYSLFKKLMKYNKIDTIYELICNIDFLRDLVDIDYHLVLIAWEYLYKNNRYDIQKMYPSHFKYQNVSKYGLSSYDYLMKLECSLGYSNEFECFLDIPYAYSTDVDTRSDVYLNDVGIILKKIARKLTIESEDEKIIEVINFASALNNHRIMKYGFDLLNKKHLGKYDQLKEFEIVTFKRYKV